jgi:cell division protein FtsB
MRYLALILSSLLILIQYPLWMGKGGWNHVWELESELAEQDRANAQRRLRNAALAAEVADLKGGTAAVEELARMQLGMIKPGELFVNISAPDPADASAPSTLAGAIVPQVTRPGTATAQETGRRRATDPAMTAAGPVSGGSATPVVAAAR